MTKITLIESKMLRFKDLPPGPFKYDWDGKLELCIKFRRAVDIGLSKYSAVTAQNGILAIMSDDANVTPVVALMEIEESDG